MPQRLRVRQGLTSWHRRSPSPIAGSSSSAPLHCDCLLYINGRRWLGRGGLAGYGPSIVQLFRDVLSRQLVKQLEGANLADLPVEQPTKFELVINVNAAKALGLTIPRSMLMLADEVIE
jgi:hypothetical protein